MTEEQFTDEDGNLVTRKVTLPHPPPLPLTCYLLPFPPSFRLFHLLLLLLLTCFCTLQVIRKVVRRVFNSQERCEDENKAEAAAAATGGGGAGGVDVAAGGVVDSAPQTAAAAGAKGAKSKRRGKRSRHSHREEAQRGKNEVGVETNRLASSAE